LCVIFPFRWKTFKKAHLENLVVDGEELLSLILWKIHCVNDDDDDDDVLRTEFS
jgi:hypothetical protein